MSWFSKLFKGPSVQPLPEFPTIALEDIPPASILLFYGGTKITEWVGNTIYKHPYKPASFHAAGYLGDGEVLNIGKEATIEDVRSMLRSTRRVDVVVLNDLTKKEREIIIKRFRRDAGKNFYDAIGFLRFGGQLKALRFLKKVHSSEKNDFCSDNVVDNFSTLQPAKRKGDTAAMTKELTLPREIRISANPAEDTAPWHLLEHALADNFQNGTRSLYTFWKGPDFKE